LLLFSGNVSEVPAFFTGHFFIENANQIHDTFISFSGWGKGIAVVNDFNIGRYWPVKELNFDFPALLSVLYFFMPLNLFYFPTFVYNFPPRLQSFGPQCNLYVPAPILRHGENVLVWNVHTCTRTFVGLYAIIPVLVSLITIFQFTH
jgi:beta-galactosidase